MKKVIRIAIVAVILFAAAFTASSLVDSFTAGNVASACASGNGGCA